MNLFDAKQIIIVDDNEINHKNFKHAYLLAKYVSEQDRNLTQVLNNYEKQFEEEVGREELLRRFSLSTEQLKKEAANREKKEYDPSELFDKNTLPKFITYLRWKFLLEELERSKVDLSESVLFMDWDLWFTSLNWPQIIQKLLDWDYIKESTLLIPASGSTSKQEDMITLISTNNIQSSITLGKDSKMIGLNSLVKDFLK